MRVSHPEAYTELIIIVIEVDNNIEVLFKLVSPSVNNTEQDLQAMGGAIITALMVTVMNFYLQNIGT